MPHTVADVPSHELETVDAQDTLISAIETMFKKGYTQLGVERDHEIVGMVSYRSISRVLSILQALGTNENLSDRRVGIAVEDINPIVEPNEDLIVLFDLLSEDPYVLVQPLEDASFEILTNYDLLHYLRDSIEPFLLVEDIERSIRTLIQDAFPDNLDEELQRFFNDKDIRTPTRIDDCSFGHYTQFIPQNWPQFEEYFKETESDGNFVRRLLEEIGRIRNKIFHFRSDSYDSKLEEELLKFSHGYFQKRAGNMG